MVPEVNHEFVSRKCSFFAAAQLWPLKSKVDPDGWLGNFDQEDRRHAIQLLNSFLYFSGNMVDRLFYSAMQGLSREVTTSGSSLANRRLEWSRFLDNAIVTFPTGEKPFAGDSGHLFVRKARDLTQFDENQILSPDKVVDELNSGSTYSAVIFVDDFVGTGQQFRKTWHRKADCGESFETLYSKQSFPVFYCPLMCTEYARGQGLFELDGKVNFSPAYWLSDNYSLFASDSIWWPKSLQSGARDFIYKYSDRIGLPMTGGSDVTDWQGYNKLGLSIAFEHCCPDATIPLYYTTLSGWTPLWRRN